MLPSLSLKPLLLRDFCWFVLVPYLAMLRGSPRCTLRGHSQQGLENHVVPGTKAGPLVCKVSVHQNFSLVPWKVCYGCCSSKEALCVSVGGAKTDARFAQALWLEQSTHPLSFPHHTSTAGSMKCRLTPWFGTLSTSSIC